MNQTNYMAKDQAWFTVDKNGLRALQEGKPKTFLIRELVQNALDENITRAVVTMNYKSGLATISVEDDSPEGFKDLTDAYTLFKHTDKRKNSNQRGRFNLGEKQVFSICKKATIITTKGGLVFDKDGRRKLRKKRDAGSIITVEVRMTRDEYSDCYDYCKNLLIPEGIEFVVDGDVPRMVVRYRKPYKTLTSALKTEVEKDGAFRLTQRKTQVNIHKPNGQAVLYEMGIPVCEIDCDYSIDVQQKVPLGTDRDKVSPAFQRDLFAEVLNVVHEDINESNASSMWVRTGTTSDRVGEEAVTAVVRGRFGDDVAVADHSDPRSVDKAISSGYNIVHGGEMSRDEWSNIKKFGAIQKTSDYFGTSWATDGRSHKPDEVQKGFAELAKKIARDAMKTTIYVVFRHSNDSNDIATFGNNTLTFNVAHLDGYWDLDEDGLPTQKMVDLLIHELGHRDGTHYESSYHELLTKLGAFLALKDPSYLRVRVKELA